ncbi:DUF967 domain protein [Rhodotorula diobovata]|uniref:DUF967 domain protein n=1 Tax=Rhodotorula diobovata TaxID=5288 RepID=A0A5C5G5C5_9BASI|nr:DUF967 domain protein [Rhodotorula diobovata]
MSFDPAAVAEAESLRLVTFTSETAFDLGLKLREHIRAKYPGQPAIVDIRSAVSEQQLFFACCAEGSLPDNACWAQRKRNAVLRWGKSTASLSLKGWGKTGIPTHYGADNADYACHGGGFPLRVKSVESLVGVAVVSCVSSGYLCSSPSSLPAARPSLTLSFLPTSPSGLKQEEDHQVIVDVLRELIAEQEKQAGAK